MNLCPNILLLFILEINTKIKFLIILSITVKIDYNKQIEPGQIFFYALVYSRIILINGFMRIQ